MVDTDTEERYIEDEDCILTWEDVENYLKLEKEICDELQKWYESGSSRNCD